MLNESEKAVSLKIDGGKLIIAVDTNKDGANIVTVVVDLVEVPDELVALIKRK